jgi:hypothetical protein
MKQTPYRTKGNCLSGVALVGMTFMLFSLSPNIIPTAVAAQAQDSTGIKRAFLDRYLDCAEAADAAARLECYDALLVDIPAWLEDPYDPPSSAIQTGAEAGPLDASESPESADH